MLNTPHFTKQKGFTLIELLLTVAVLGIVMAVAMPSISAMATRNKLKSFTETLVQDIQLARSEAMLKNSNVFVNVNAGAAWCYGIDTAAVCDCTVANDCDTKVVSSNSFRGISLNPANTDVANLSFNPVGVVNIVNNGGKVEILAGAMAARIHINPIGRIRTCSNDIPSFGNALNNCP